METFEELINQCIQHFERQRFSVARIGMYKFLWLNKLMPYMQKEAIPCYDATVGEKFLRTIVTGDIISRYQDDIIRSINFLTNFKRQVRSKGIISNPLNGSSRGRSVLRWKTIYCTSHRYEGQRKR
jgi:hypothetical protein